MSAVINYKEYDFKESTVIKPQSTHESKHDNYKYTRVVIDSRDRNLSYFSTPSTYEISLPDDIEDVVAAELQIMDLPFSAYMIDENNCVLHMSLNSGLDLVQVTIPKGDYTTTSLPTAIEAAAVNMGINLTVTYLPERDNFKFTMSQPFILSFIGEEVKYHSSSLVSDTEFTTTYKKNSMAKVIGFGPKTYLSHLDATTSKHTLFSEFRKSFRENKYIIMHIEQITINQSINSIIHKSFAVIPPRAVDMNLYQIYQIRKNLNPPIAKLGKLKIRFTNHYGQPYDFQNQDHRFDIIFESLKSPRRYHSYFVNS